MATEKNSVQRVAGLTVMLAMSLSMGALTACGSEPATTTTRTVTTDTVAPAMPQSQTTTVQKTTTSQ